MKLLNSIAACAALAMCVGDAFAQGPVRQGLRRTGDIAAGGTRRAVDATGRAADRTVDATGRAVEGAGQAVRGTGQAARNVAGATARGVRGGVDRLTPIVPLEARADANLQAGDQGRNAGWRMRQHNSEWWYYSPQNSWMYHRDGQWNDFAADSFEPINQSGGQQFANQQAGEQYTAGYRGDPSAQFGGGQPMHGQQHHMVRVDRHGREFICENGRPVYLTSHGQAQNQAGYDQGRQEWSAGYRGEAFDQGSPTPAEPQQPQPALDESTPDEAAPPDAAASAEADAAASPPAEPAPQAAEQPQAETPSQPQASDSPASPRELNNNPNPAAEGDATTSGSADGDTLR